MIDALRIGNPLPQKSGIATPLVFDDHPILQCFLVDVPDRHPAIPADIPIRNDIFVAIVLSGAQ